MIPSREPLPSRVRAGSSAGTPPEAGTPAAAGIPGVPVREPLPTDARDLPPLPAAFSEALDDGLDRLGLGLTGEQHAALDAYVRMLLRWTEAINLTAIREPASVARDHLVDSLTAVPLLAGVDRIADLGSGGGAPGLPLAIAVPSVRMLLVESIGKKAGFLRAAVRAVEAVAPALGIAARVDVAADRAEVLAADGHDREAFDAVTVRAVGPLPDLIELAFPLLRVGGTLIAWKRDPFEAELAAGRNAARALGGSIDVRDVAVPGLEDRRLAVVTKLRPTPRRYPRPPAERRRRPL